MSEEAKSANFIEEIIENDIKQGVNSGIVITRFPPEPNGYLHIGHAKSICLNFGLAIKYNGQTNLRFDDTNPVTEETEYVEGIKEDIKWLGFTWKNEFYASDYFDKLYEYACDLIKKGLAYVDDSTSEEIAFMKGTPTTPGKDSPFRNREVIENIMLFEKMKNGVSYASNPVILKFMENLRYIDKLGRGIPLVYQTAVKNNKELILEETGEEFVLTLTL